MAKCVRREVLFATILSRLKFGGWNLVYLPSMCCISSRTVLLLIRVSVLFSPVVSSCFALLHHFWFVHHVGYLCLIDLFCILTLEINYYIP